MRRLDPDRKIYPKIEVRFRSPIIDRHGLEHRYAMDSTLMKAAVALIVLGGFVALLNWWSLYASYRDKKFHSSVPLLGAGLLGVGMFILPSSRRYSWSAIFFDYGTLVFLIALPTLVKEGWSASKRDKKQKPPALR
jgi:hypothetical protein